MTSRRTFVFRALPAALSLGIASRHGVAAAPPRVEESDPTAVALGYRHDATKVDPKKFPKYQPGQICANCALYQGKASDPWAPCPALAGKLVNAKGWCTAWVKKA